MMGNRGKLQGGEVDALTRAKRFYGPAAGVRKWWKRLFWSKRRTEQRSSLATKDTPHD